MTPVEFSRLVNRLSYKTQTHAKFVLQYNKDMKPPALKLSIQQVVPDVNNRNDRLVRVNTTLGTHQIWSEAEVAQIDEETMLGRIYDMLLSMEEHEIREWFRIDGKCVVDPHPENRAQAFIDQLKDYVTGRWKK